MSHKRHVWETVSEYLSQQGNLSGHGLAVLEKQVGKLGREQYKANTLAEAQAERMESTLEALQANLERLELVQNEAVLKARLDILEALLPVLDSLEAGLKNGVDLRNDRKAMARLNRAAEKVKIELSTHPFAWAREEYLAEKRGKPLHLEVEVSRREFEGLIGDLLGSTRTSIQQALTDAKMTIKDLDKVLLVGGSTYIPAVWELAADATGLDPRQEVHPSEAVALGAGVQAAIIAGQPIEAILVDVTPHSLGIEVSEMTWCGWVDDRYSVLIHRNTTIPVTRENVYNTLYPDQDTIHFQVYQGEQPIASKNTLLGEFKFTGLQPEREGELAKVTVRFSLNVNGMLQVKTHDRGSDRETGITVTAMKERLSQEQLSQAQKRLAEAVPTLALDEAGQALVDRARKLLESTELEPENAQELVEALAMIDEARRLGDEPEMENWLEELTDLLYELED